VLKAFFLLTLVHGEEGGQREMEEERRERRR
jgi:hypothetical protein